jgi:ribonucleoside-diphosphate reductase alpha chain
VGQPLADGGGKAKKDAADAVAAAADEASKVVEKIVYTPARKRLPKSRVSRTTSFTVGGAEGYMTSGAHDDGQLGEVFLKLGKQGSTLAGVMDAFSIAVSIGLQYGVPLETYVSKFTNLRFEPSGMTDDPDIRMAQSLMDYVFRRLALDYLSFEDRSMLGIYSAEERQRHLETGSYEPLEETGGAGELIQATVVEPTSVVEPVETTGDHDNRRDDLETKDTHGSEAREVPAQVSTGEAKTTAELFEKLTGTAVDSPLCMTCGTKMRPAGSCYVCEGCGSTSGCS